MLHRSKLANANQNEKDKGNMDQRLYTIAGTSIYQGQLTWRFANGSLTQREATLKRHGHDDIKLIELPREMTAEQAMKYLGRKGVKAVVPKRGRKPALVVAGEQRKVG